VALEREPRGDEYIVVPLNGLLKIDPLFIDRSQKVPKVQKVRSIEVYK
jgi:hypothetical protein